MTRLSVIVITYNEEKYLPRFLESVKWADQIVVVDSFSQDRTREIASQCTKDVYHLEWKGFGRAKQFALQKALGEWILSLDADEVVSECLRNEIMGVMEDPSAKNGYYISRTSQFLGRWMKHGGWQPDFVLRLAKRGTGHFTEAAVHEQLVVSGESGYLKEKLLHFTDPDLNHYLSKMNRYTTLAAEEAFTKGARASLADMLIRPTAIFVKRYIFKAGFLDGLHGLLLAFFSSFHVLTKYAKLWHLGWREHAQAD